ncbi:glycosyltransferase family 4 protein [Oryzobacter sp. R7]|uniref:glycosyltransferase family 4 protein n=1 Tax=Oryzobacter faecalis TaxID=3388656 RepID=UPI00398CFA3E
MPVTVDTFQREMIRQLLDEGLDVTLVSSPGDRLSDVAADLGVESVAVPMMRALSPLRDVVALGRWLVLLARLRPDLVVAATPKASLLAMLAARVTRVPVRLYSAVGLRLEGEHGWRRALLVTMERLTAGSATAVVPNSPSLAARYRDLRLARPSTLFPTRPASSHGVDTDHFTPRDRDPSIAEQLGLGDGRRVIGFVGRLTRDKGIDDLVAAAALVEAAGVPTRLLVVGPQDEPDSSHYLEVLRAGPVPVVALGEVSDVRPYLACMDVHVLPTLREGFPNVVLEAGAMGIPTVTTRATGSVDSVDDGVTGLLVDVHDPKGLADAMTRILRDPDLGRRLGEAARAVAIEQFDPQAVVRSHLAPAMAALGLVGREGVGSWEPSPRG